MSECIRGVLFSVKLKKVHAGTIKGSDMCDLIVAQRYNVRTDQRTARSISMLLAIKAGHSLHGACSSYDPKGVK